MGLIGGEERPKLVVPKYTQLNAVVAERQRSCIHDLSVSRVRPESLKLSVPELTS